ncbi:MAG: MCE family protein [Microvirga sp.]|nr:MCE family protein [Microvirga sp.]
METRANYALIGLFTLFVVAGAFLFVYWFAVSEKGQERLQVQILFRDSVAGLSRGSSVSFNGLRVGEVAELRLDPQDPGTVIARIVIDATTPVRSDTRARLEYQGLTGIAAVSLTGGSSQAPALAAAPGAPAPSIVAEPSDFQDLLRTGQEIARSASETLNRVNRLVDANFDTITATVTNVEQFSRALGDNAPAIDNFLEQVGNAAERVAPLANSLEELSRSTNAIVSAVDPETVAATVRNVESFTQTLADSRGQIDQIFADAATMTGRLNAASVRLETTLEDVSAAVRAVDAGRINATIENVEAFSQTLAENRENVSQIIGNAATLTENLNVTAGRIDVAVEQISSLAAAVDRDELAATISNVQSFSRVLAENGGDVGEVLRRAGEISRAIDPEQIAAAIDSAERFANALGARSGDIDGIVANAAELVEKLNASADRVDGVLAAAEGFLGSAEEQAGEGFFNDIREAAQAIRVLADNLDARTAEITAGINRFTGPGLQEYRALADDGRRTLEDISRTFRALERNPQQLLFGGQSSVPEFNGRR